MAISGQIVESCLLHPGNQLVCNMYVYIICFVFSDTPRISLTMTQTLDGDLIRKGDTVYLHCEVKANPAVHTVEWTRNEVSKKINIGSK